MPAVQNWTEVSAILERCDHLRQEPVLDAVILAPLRYPGKILCAGANYWSHLREMGGSAEQGALDDPFFFLLPASSIVGPGEPIEIPTDDHANVDWEGELAVVIGRSARNVSVEHAQAHVAGYTICNDVSARGLHRRTSYRGPTVRVGLVEVEGARHVPADRARCDTRHGSCLTPTTFICGCGSTTS